MSDFLNSVVSSKSRRGGIAEGLKHKLKRSIDLDIIIDD
jgi:hypothetical protein